MLKWYVYKFERVGRHILKLFDVVYKINNKKVKTSISEVIFYDFKKDLISKGGEIISTEERALPNRKKKACDRNTIEKSKYYYSKYGTEKRRLDNKRITKKEFEKRIELLKKLREECRTRTEFKRKYERIY